MQRFLWHFSVWAPVALAMLLAGCSTSASGHAQGGTGPGVLGSLRVASQSVAAYPQYPDIDEVHGSLGVTVRRFVLRGDWTVLDYTDRICLLRRNRGGTYPDTDLWRLDLSDGHRALLLARPVNARRRFTALTARASDGWIAWEEVQPVDDLRFPARWLLYAARVGPGGELGPARLIDGGETSRRSRPLFALDGGTLCWMVDAGRDGGKGGTVWACDLKSGHPQPRVLVTSDEAFHTLGVVHGYAVVTERQSDATQTLTCRAYSLADGSGAFSLDLANRQPVVQFPAWSPDALAWSILRDSGYAASGALYLRLADGSGHLVSVRDAVHPVLARGTLFYQSMGDYGGGVASSTIHALDLATLSDVALERCDYERDGQWLLPFSSPSARHTAVAYRLTGHSVGFASKRTTIDAFFVR